MPPVGTPFNDGFVKVIEDAVRINPSVHDGAVIFSRTDESDGYLLSSWSMRIVSNRSPVTPAPNVGSAHNSALALSMAPTVDLCVIISKAGMVLCENGLIKRTEIPPC